MNEKSSAGNEKISVKIPPNKSNAPESESPAEGS